MKLHVHRAFELNLHQDMNEWVASTRGANGSAPLPELQKDTYAGEECCGRNPYPGLSNLGSACYLNAVLQALMHCGPARLELFRWSCFPPDMDSESEQLRTAIGCVVQHEPMSALSDFTAVTSMHR